MTRKHYETAAEAMRSLDPSQHRTDAIEVLVRMFARDNPRFKAQLFRDACEATTTYKNRSRHV